MMIAPVWRDSESRAVDRGWEGTSTGRVAAARTTVGAALRASVAARQVSRGPHAPTRASRGMRLRRAFRIGGDQDPAAATVRGQAHGQHARQFGDETVSLGDVEGGGDLQPARGGRADRQRAPAIAVQIGDDLGQGRVVIGQAALAPAARYVRA
jgi:hypothetical protein